MRLRHLSPGSALWVMPVHAVYYALNWKAKSHVIFIAVGSFFKDEAQNSILKMKIEKNTKSAMHWKILKKYIGQDIYVTAYNTMYMYTLSKRLIFFHFSPNLRMWLDWLKIFSSKIRSNHQSFNASAMMWNFTLIDQISRSFIGSYAINMLFRRLNRLESTLRSTQRDRPVLFVESCRRIKVTSEA